MKIEARIKEAHIPIDETTAKLALIVEYRKADSKSGWMFHSIYTDECLARYVKESIESGDIQVLVMNQ